MNNKVKKLLIQSMLFLLVLYSLSACSPKIISKVKAKEAGLELINLAFDTNETDADVVYYEMAGGAMSMGYRCSTEMKNQSAIT